MKPLLSETDKTILRAAENILHDLSNRVRDTAIARYHGESGATASYLLSAGALREQASVAEAGLRSCRITLDVHVDNHGEAALEVGEVAQP